MRFERPVAQNTEQLTAEQVDDIIKEAHRTGLPSIALAQALQFEAKGKLRQKDVIGEWVPEEEPGPSGIRHNGEKWIHGVLWSEVSRGTLRHNSSFDNAEIIIDLNECPRVLAQLEYQKAHGANRKSDAPLIVHETTGRPYIAHQFRYHWRQIADAVGISKKVRMGNR